MERQFQRTANGVVIGATLSAAGVVMGIASLPLEQRKTAVKGIVLFFIGLLMIVPATACLGMFGEIMSGKVAVVDRTFAWSCVAFFGFFPVVYVGYLVKRVLFR